MKEATTGKGRQIPMSFAGEAAGVKEVLACGEGNHYNGAVSEGDINMEITLQTFLIVCPFVFLAGCVDAIAGGGGLISLPAYFLAGLPPHMAIATNKLSSSIGTLTASLRFYKEHFVKLDAALIGIAAALCGSAIGSNLSLLADEDLIRVILLPLLPFVAWHVLRGKGLQEQKREMDRSQRHVYSMVALCSFGVGMYDGFYGPGTGTFLILLFTAFAGMRVAQANGTSKLINLASNVMSLLIFLFNGQVLLCLGIVAALCSVVGNYIGSTLVMKNGIAIVRPLIIAVLGILFVKILVELL